MPSKFKLTYLHHVIFPLWDLRFRLNLKDYKQDFTQQLGYGLMTLNTLTQYRYTRITGQAWVGIYRQSPIFLLLAKNFFQLINVNKATFHHFETACPHFSNILLQSDKIDYNLFILPSKYKQIFSKKRRCDQNGNISCSHPLTFQ